MTKAEIARLRSLREKKHREAAGLFVVEGPKVVSELLAEGIAFAEIYATAGWSAPEGGGLPVQRVTDAEMERISHYPTPSSVLAVGKINRLAFSQDALSSGLTLVLDDVQDAGNVGTLLRIADWYAYDRVLCSPECADIFSQKVINASMGSFCRVKVHVTPLAEALSQAKAQGIPILGCDLGGEGVHTLPSMPNAIVVIGSEGRGLSAPVRDCVTRFVTIPRYGRAESLNAAVAAAIVSDNLRRLSK